MADWKDVAIEAMKMLRWVIPALVALFGLGGEIDYRLHPPDEAVIPRALNPVAQLPSRSETDREWLKSEPAREAAKARIRESAPERAVPPNASVLHEGDCQGDPCWQDCNRSRPCPSACVCSDWRGGRCLPR